MPSILILCTDNSCRSQMAEGILKFIAPDLEVYSAGTQPVDQVHPKAAQVMREIDIDISDQSSKTVEQFLDRDFDYVITVCDHALETCPVFTGSVKSRLHRGFEDPAQALGSESEILAVFRQVRDQIRSRLEHFYHEHLCGKEE
jgi:arsenate reductase